MESLGNYRNLPVGDQLIWGAVTKVDLAPRTGRMLFDTLGQGSVYRRKTHSKDGLRGCMSAMNSDLGKTEHALVRCTASSIEAASIDLRGFRNARFPVPVDLYVGSCVFSPIFSVRPTYSFVRVALHL